MGKSSKHAKVAEWEIIFADLLFYFYQYPFLH